MKSITPDLGTQITEKHLKTHPQGLLHQERTTLERHIFIYYCFLLTHYFLFVLIHLRPLDPCMTFNETINNILKICVGFYLLNVSTT